MKLKQHGCILDEALPKRRWRFLKTYGDLERDNFKNDSLYENSLKNAKEQGFTSLMGREIYQRLVKNYRNKLPKIHIRKIGYDIEKIEKGKRGNLIVTLLEEGNVEQDYIHGLESVFKKCSLQLSKIVPENNFELIYNGKQLNIIPYSANSRAFLEGYVIFLEREIVKKE